MPDFNGYGRHGNAGTPGTTTDDDMRLPALAIVLCALGASPEARSELILCPTALRSDCDVSEKPSGERIKPRMCERRDCRVLPPIVVDGVRVCTVTCRQHFY